ncbi:MAG: LacI family DNA-binding transcriptional regulator [Chthoniobacterales bacterium]
MFQKKNASKVDMIYDDLESRILNGEWEIGNQIPTEAELAKKFNCSRGTVSKAIARLIHEGFVNSRTKSGTRVANKTSSRSREKVQLDAGAYIFPGEQHEAVSRIGQGFQRAACEEGRRVVTVTTGADFRKDAEIIGRLDEFDVKGAVVYPTLWAPRDRIYFEQMLLKCRFPVVLVDISLPGFGAPAVVIDGYHAGYTITRHLLAQGIRKIGFLSNGAWVPSVQARYGGYCWALEEAGIERKPQWAFLEQELHADFRNPVERSHPFTRQYFKTAGSLEGVFCCDDFIALSCLATAKKMGLRVPEDLKVIGFGDYAISAKSGLTTYRVPYEELGRKAFHVLADRMLGQKVPEMDQLLRGHVVVRKSA